MQNSTIKGYTLTHKIGEGGMAEVWQADNEIGKKAAVKILRKDLSLNEDIVARFKNEAKVMVTLDHPNIRQVYDYGQIDGRPCIIMEYLDGADLSVRLKKGERFSSEQLTQWWNQLADALNYTHAKEVVHRDIKPSNIFITADGKLKLLDFGIAKIRGSVTITQTGSRMGTLMYMSPEQVKDSKNVDHRTDVYSLAVTFYHLLTGTSPYDNTKSSEFEIQVKIVNETLDLTKLTATWRKFLHPYLHKEPFHRPELTSFTSNPQPQPQPYPQPQPDPETEIKKPPIPPPTPPLVASKNYTAYWLLAAAVVVIIVLLIVNSNNNAEKERMAERQRTEQLARQQQADQNAWNTAKNTNTKAAYEQYLSDYPQGRFTADARSKINEIDKQEEQNRQAKASQQADQNAWNAAKNTNTKAAYEKYIRDYPQGNYVADARSRINEIDGNEAERNRQQADQNAWNTAKNTNTKAAYEKYIRDYPQGNYVADARSRINEIDGNEAERNRQQADQNAWNAAKNTNTKAAYEKYLRDYPQGRFASDARSKISEAERATAGSSQGKPSIEWVNIPAGTFMMGSPVSEKDRGSNETQHQVTLSAFRMSKYEVTFEQYDAFCEATGRRKPADEGWGRGKRPVINVSWHDAKAFADWMGCRLPTEAEWEYAARAGTTTPFNTGNCISSTQANYNGNYPYSGCSKGEYRQKTMPVGSFPANAWGLHDMHGNVWEWCSDWYGAYPTAAQTNPKGSASGSDRVIRGGSWYDTANICRSARRNSLNPVNRNDGIGFRLVSP